LEKPKDKQSFLSFECRGCVYAYTLVQATKQRINIQVLAGIRKAEDNLDYRTFPS
jgi:hypothetical protein